MTDPQTPNLPQHLIDLRRGALRKPLRFDLKPTRAESAAIAAALDISGVADLRFKGVLAPAGKVDAALEATLTASVVQPCIVTLEPVTTAITDEVKRRYLADWQDPEGDETEIPEDDTAEALPATLDLWAVAVEALALALPLYPRAPGADLGEIAATPPGAEPLGDADLKPFAGLAALRAKLAPEGGSGSE